MDVQDAEDAPIAADRTPNLSLLGPRVDPFSQFGGLPLHDRGRRFCGLLQARQTTFIKVPKTEDKDRRYVHRTMLLTMLERLSRASKRGRTEDALTSSFSRNAVH